MGIEKLINEQVVTLYLEEKEMKQFVGLETVKKNQIQYPSPKNPRTRDLNAKSPDIVALAKSIEKNGLFYRPILRRQNGTYEVIDGDRRLIALFDRLGETSVEAFVWKIDDKEADIMRLVSNWDRKDLTSQEKGRYLWYIIKNEMASDGKAPVEDFWKEREIRGEYITRISNIVGKSTGTVAKYITLWLETPEEYREVIREKKERIIEGAIRPSQALKITSIGSKLGNVTESWKTLAPQKLKDKELDIVKKGIRDGKISNIEQMKTFVNQEVSDWDKISIFIKKEDRQLASKLASQHDTQIDKIFRATLYVAQAHKEELANALVAI